MDNQFINQLKLLREQIPIGYSEGLQYLKTFNNNIDYIIDFFKKEYIKEVVAKTNLSEDKILPYLIHFKYDKKRTISALEDEFRLINGTSQTYTRYTLHSSKNDKESAINHISSAIIKESDIKRPCDIAINSTYWFEETELNKLNNFHKLVVSLTEWLDYIDSEDLKYSVHYNFDLIQEQLKVLNLSNHVGVIRLIKSVIEDMKSQYDTTTIEGHCDCYNEISTNSDYKHAKIYFYENRHLIIETLYNFIKENVSQFP